VGDRGGGGVLRNLCDGKGKREREGDEGDKEVTSPVGAVRLPSD